MIKKEWKTLDVIEKTEEIMHAAVRLRNPGADPPKLEAKRTSPQEVTIFYGSRRKMCAFGVGICRGIANLFREQVTITHPACMHHGAEKCRIVVRKIS